jgi:hypothetical protein
MIRSRSPSTAAAVSKPGSSRTFFVPWSGRITAVTAASTSGSSPIAVSVATQSSGRLNVGMPMVTAARPAPSSAAYQPPACRVRSSASVVRSNQYQPPSSNGRRSSSRSSSCRPGPSSTTPRTKMAEPSALLR